MITHIRSPLNPTRFLGLMTPPRAETAVVAGYLWLAHVVLTSMRAATDATHDFAAHICAYLLCGRPAICPGVHISPWDAKEAT